jgi:heat shock protein HslJ
MKRLCISIIIIILAAPVSACTTRNQAAQVELEDSTWVLTSLENSHPIDGRQLTIQFENGQVSGNAGCNSYGGSYTIKADEISFDAIFSTEMACLEPEGLMKQEQAYLGLLQAASRFEATEGELRVFVGEDPLLIYTAKADSPASPAATPLPSSTVPPAATPTLQGLEPTPSPTLEPPAGYKEYRDSIAGISISIPETWSVTGAIGGKYAILQSYPEDKYVGGEPRETGDSKCDLNIHPAGTTAADIIQQWESEPSTTIISDEELTLDSGLTGRWLILESMGRSAALLTEVNNRAITLTCFGSLDPFEGIAATLNGFEPAPSSPIYESPEGFKRYRDTETGVTLDMPASWTVSGIVPGQRAVIQSYPEDKYIGGEAFEPGDTKCDLFIRSDTSVDEFLSQMKANEAITIIAEGQITLDSGQIATSVEIQSMGLSDLVVTEINAYTVVLTCYGDFTPVHAIAVTLRARD